LQKEPRADDSAALRERNDIVDLTAHLSDFAHTAALISCLDLVITVDQHRPSRGRTWMSDLGTVAVSAGFSLVARSRRQPMVPDDAAFRQRAPGDYVEVIDRVRTELAAMIAARK
jgi:hypothetical protein